MNNPRLSHKQERSFYTPAPYSKPRPVKTERRCMCCARKFMSAGNHHRLCDGCKDRV